MDDSLDEWKRQKCQEFFLRLADVAFEMLPEFFPDSHRKGQVWETEFRAMCNERRLFVSEKTGREDLVVSGARVQCKNIDDIRNGVIDISNMRPVKSNGGLRGYHAGEVDVFAIRHRGDVFLVPASAIADENGRLKGRVSLAYINSFLNNWSVFDASYTPPPKSVQKPLF
jgi:hypothetical protein